MTLLSHLLERWHSRRCLCCTLPVLGAQLCSSCTEQLQAFSDYHINLIQHPDVERIVAIPHCDGLTAACWYQLPQSQWLKGMKFQQQKHCQLALTALAQRLWLRFCDEAPITADIVCCLPLHPQRLIQRGYNQVEQAFKPLPLQPSVLLRDKKTRPQSRLSVAQRQQNVTAAFSLKQPLHGKKIVLIDDVITTGATIDSAAKTCKEGGADMVWAMALCLTPYQAND